MERHSLQRASDLRVQPLRTPRSHTEQLARQDSCLVSQLVESKARKRLISNRRIQTLMSQSYIQTHWNQLKSNRGNDIACTSRGTLSCKLVDQQASATCQLQHPTWQPCKHTTPLCAVSFVLQERMSSRHTSHSSRQHQQQQGLSNGLEHQSPEHNSVKHEPQDSRPVTAAPLPNSSRNQRPRRSAAAEAAKHITESMALADDDINVDAAGGSSDEDRSAVADAGRRTRRQQAMSASPADVDRAVRAGRTLRAQVHKPKEVC